MRVIEIYGIQYEHCVTHWCLYELGGHCEKCVSFKNRISQPSLSQAPAMIWNQSQAWAEEEALAILMGFSWCNSHKISYESISCPECSSLYDAEYGYKHKNPECECGAHKIKDSAHSNWCPLWVKL